MHGILPCLFHPIGPPIVRQFTGKWFTSIGDLFRSSLYFVVFSCFSKSFLIITNGNLHDDIVLV